MKSGGLRTANRRRLPAVKDIAQLDLDQIDMLGTRIKELSTGLRVASEERQRHWDGQNVSL